jgi:hypothetical protein
MTILSWDKQLDLVEQQFSEVSVLLVSGESTDLVQSSTLLQKMAVELLHSSHGLVATDAQQFHRRAARIQGLARSLPVLREGLIRKLAYVESALKVVMPSAPSGTYADRGPYGNTVRQSGSFKVLSA